jgi:mercuric ion transport protein
MREREMSGFSRWSRFAFNVAAWLFVGCVCVQVYLAGVGVFASGSFDTHRDFGYTFGLLTLVLIVLAIIGRLPRRWIGASAALLVLFGLQSVLVAFRGSVPMFAALHPLNGFLIGLFAFVIAWQTRGYLRAPAAETQTKTV